jgi:DNA-binding NtrC family response regulator
LTRVASAGPLAAARRLLIVEDERRLREMLHAAATEMGLVPTVASSAEGAIRLLEHEAFSVALVDLNLPGMDGLDLCEQLHRCRPPVQVVILTGFGDLDAARRAIRLEVVDFLTKPCGMDDLEMALVRAQRRWLDRWDGPAPVAEPLAEAPVPRPPPAGAGSDAGWARPSIETVERELIVAALGRHGGNRQAAAAELGISVRKLYYRLRQYQRPGPPAGQAGAG